MCFEAVVPRHNDMPHGNGCWHWKDGAKFVGRMQEGKRHGFGILFYGRERGESNKLNMSQSGEGEHSDGGGVNIEYEGNW